MKMKSSDTRRRVLVVHNDTPQPAIDLLKMNCDVTLMESDSPTTAEVIKLIPKRDALLGAVLIDTEFLDVAGSRLKIISTLRAGFDHMDIIRNKKIFNESAFEQMKETAVFVNIGRGKTVDTEALVKALKSGAIFAAGLDVTEPEPLPVGHELMRLSNACRTFKLIRHVRKFVNSMTMTTIGARPRVLVVHNDTPQTALDLLKTKCDFTVMGSNWPTQTEILKLIPEYDALFGVVPVDAKFLDVAGSRLKIISTPTAGYDHLDVAEIKKRGIKVGHTPKILSAAVAETAVFLLLGAARRAHEGRLELEQGKTGSGFSWLLGHDLRNKTVGIVGLGNIGVEILKRLKPFEIKKFVYTGHSRKKIGDELGAEFVSFDDLLKQSDFVIDSVPLNSETEKMFNDDAFKKMKKTSVFVNIGRGKTVDTEALVNALKSGTIFAAGLDVTEPEPLPVDHELLKLPNVVIVPHMGTQTVETESDMAIAAVQNILYGFDGKALLYEL